MGISTIIARAAEDPLQCGIDEIEALLTAPVEAHDEIWHAADALNRSLNGDEVSYIVNRNVNFTNQCTLGCAFCGFSMSPDNPSSFILGIDEVIARIGETPFIDEVCIQGGISPNVPPSFYFDLLAEIGRAFPAVAIHAYSPQEVFSLAEKLTISTRVLLDRLRDAGLDTMPGTAAEILGAATRRMIAPRKIDGATWERIVTEAHRAGIRTTATMMFGHIETDREIAEHLATLRRIQQASGGFTEFVPLPFIPELTPLARSGRRFRGSTTLARLVYAIARLSFGTLIPNIQTSWVKLGPGEAVATLDIGVNDFGGTLYEENITKSAGGTNGELLTEEQIVALIRSAGRQPVRRTTEYHRLTAVRT